MQGLGGLGSQNIKVNFDTKSAHIQLLCLNNLNYQLVFYDLLHPIVTDKCSFKVSNDVLTIFLKKQSPEKWDCLKAQEKKHSSSMPTP